MEDRLERNCEKKLITKFHSDSLCLHGNSKLFIHKRPCRNVGENELVILIVVLALFLGVSYFIGTQVFKGSTQLVTCEDTSIVKDSF